jgi:RNA polymerase sigma factor (TIGR02999 family)
VTDRSDFYDHNYEALLRVAQNALREFPNTPLSPRTVVHEAWRRLSTVEGQTASSKEHFFARFATAMRRVLVDEARRQKAGRRGGGALTVVFDEEVPDQVSSIDDVLDIDSALSQLSRIELKDTPGQRLAAIAELYFFAGLTVREVAETMQLSESTIDRDVRAIRRAIGLHLGRGSTR